MALVSVLGASAGGAAHVRVISPPLPRGPGVKNARVLNAWTSQQWRPVDARFKFLRPPLSASHSSSVYSCGPVLVQSSPGSVLLANPARAGSVRKMSLSDLTPEWDDDERMDFMFSAFKENRDVDEKDWDSKVDFWSVLVLKSCRRLGTVSVSLQELEQMFRRKNKSPLGLPTVLRAMSRY